MSDDEKDDDNMSQDSESTSDSHICCCLCYSAVDFSEKEAFYKEEESEDKKKLLLPKELYDAQNALVLCDSCDRPYHQRCHFIPVISLPRGDWHCLLCKEEQDTSGTKSRKKKQQHNNSHIYPFPPKNPEGHVLVNVEAQHAWEFQSSYTKAVAWKREFVRLQKALTLQMQTIRLAQDAIRSHTTSSRKITNPLKSQELCQCVTKCACSKLRIRQWFQSLEKVLHSYDGDWNAIQEFVQEHPDQEQTWFPYGRDLERRVVPRCGHDDENGKNESGVPTEVVVKDDDTSDDDDDMISLDDLQCCICFRGDATDENDVILCDGQGCFRAYHMNCVSPRVTLEQVEEEEDWFCPICTAMAKLLGNVQSEYTGDDWQGEDDETTIRSWDQANDVFPEAEKEYEMAVKWKEGQHDAEMAEFISNLLGMPIENGGGNSNSGGDSQEDHDDDSEDDDFDLNAFQNRKREEEDESDASSKATLQDMSDVEDKIDRKELDALSLPSDDSSDNEDDEDGRRRIRSTRSSRATSANNSSDEDGSSSSNRPDGGTLDESNILVGKRRRAQVDYRRLNDSMFGDVSSNEAAKIDDDDEFQVNLSSRRNSSSSSDSSSDEDSGSESGTDESSSNESEEPTKGRKKRASKQRSSDEAGSDTSEVDEPPKKTKRRVSTKKGSKAASKTKRWEDDNDSDSAEEEPPAKRATKKGASSATKTSPASRKRRASKQKMSDESSSDGSKPQVKTRGKKQALQKTKPATGNGKNVVNGKKTRRAKRAKWDN